MENINKIIRTLDLAKSDARDETLQGILKFIIYSDEKGINPNDIFVTIKKEFSIEVHQSEIEESIDKLIDKGFVIKESENLKLSIDEYNRIRLLNLKNEENNISRFQSFSAHIQDIALTQEYAVVEVEIEKLWQIFKEFLYECYLLHGKTAIINFTNEYNESNEDINSILKNKTKGLTKDQEKLLTEYIKRFPSYLDSTLLSYLTELADKTEAFYALGLSQEEYDKIYSDLKFDWIIL